MHIYTRLILIYIIALFSCKKDTPETHAREVDNSFGSLFEAYWTKMSMNYVYWDADTTDWAKIYIQYKPKFDRLNIHSAADQTTSINYFRMITRYLLDGHYTMNIRYDQLLPISINPSADKKRELPEFHSPFIYAGVDSLYLDKGYVAGTYITLTGEQIFAMSGSIDQHIIYFTCSQFDLQEAYNAPTANGIKNVMDYFHSKLSTLSSNNKLKGIIIDLRNNSGGNIVDLNFFVGKLSQKNILFGKTRYKIGSGKKNFSPWIDAKILGNNTTDIINYPIAILIDNYTKSLAELIAIALHASPYSKIIGDQSWGATGILADSDLYNAGSFTIGSYITVYTASAQFQDQWGKSYEGKGILPDERSLFNQQQLNSGIDSTLIKALHWLK